MSIITIRYNPPEEELARALESAGYNHKKLELPYNISQYFKIDLSNGDVWYTIKLEANTDIDSILWYDSFGKESHEPRPAWPRLIGEIDAIIKCYNDVTIEQILQKGILDPPKDNTAVGNAIDVINKRIYQSHLATLESDAKLTRQLLQYILTECHDVGLVSRDHHSYAAYRTLAHAMDISIELNTDQFKICQPLIQVHLTAIDDKEEILENGEMDENLYLNIWCVPHEFVLDDLHRQRHPMSKSFEDHIKDLVQVTITANTMYGTPREPRIARQHAIKDIYNGMALVIEHILETDFPHNEEDQTAEYWWSR